MPFSFRQRAPISGKRSATAFPGSAARRARWRGPLRNACVAAGNARAARTAPHAPESARLRERLAALAASADAIIAEHAICA